ncbi:unnamed protein product, partial [Rotaria magnacalcarata]
MEGEENEKKQKEPPWQKEKLQFLAILRASRIPYPQRLTMTL